MPASRLHRQSPRPSPPTLGRYRTIEHCAQSLSPRPQTLGILRVFSWVYPQNGSVLNSMVCTSGLSSQFKCGRCSSGFLGQNDVVFRNRLIEELHDTRGGAVATHDLTTVQV